MVSFFLSSGTELGLRGALVERLHLPADGVRVRGVDKYHHFDDEPRPVADLDEAALAAHADSVSRQVKALYQGTEKTAFRA